VFSPSLHRFSLEAAVRRGSPSHPSPWGCLRLAMNLKNVEPESEVCVFLMGDAVV
jgi:hypothetical protein